MTTQKFELQEKRMESFLYWLHETVKSVKEISQDQYEQIFTKIKDKA